MVKTELEKFRTRWRRWLGQMTRCDRDTWVELLDCNWLCWSNKVLDRAYFKYPRVCISFDLLDVRRIYEEAINIATMEELRELDTIYCEKVLIRG